MPERIVVHRILTAEKVCAVCGRTFEGVSKQLYCSKVCQRKADYGNHADDRRAARRARYQREKV